MIFGYSIYELIQLFFLYAFLGWCAEVCYAAVTVGKFSNRGFLNGPICPIYGVGALIVILALSPIADNLFLLFFSSMILTSLLEYVTGLVLEKIFHAKWWDYTDRPFNLQGYICLQFSILWGLACTGIMRLVHPVLYRLVGHLPHILGLVLNSLFLVLLLTDLVATVMAIHHLNQRLALITRTAQRIHSMSDRLGETLYEGAVATKARSQEAREVLEDSRDKLEQQKLSLEGKVAGMQTRALADAEERAIARAEKASRRREAAQLRSEATAQELALLQSGQHAAKEDPERAELAKKLKKALTERHFLQDRILRGNPGLKLRHDQGAFAQLRKFRQRGQEAKLDPEAILEERPAKEPVPHPHSFPHYALAFLVGLAVGVVLMLVLGQYTTMLI
jgi:uncharacterized membrane protein